MQAALKFFDFPFSGAGGQGVKKIGIKLPDRAADQPSADENGFMEIMAALTRIPPQELNNSLAQLDWVPVEDAGGELAPLIDLTDQADRENAILQMLMPRKGTDTPAPRLPLRAAAGLQEINPDQGKNAGVLDMLQLSEDQQVTQAPSAETMPLSDLPHQQTKEGMPRAVPTQVTPPNRGSELAMVQTLDQNEVRMNAIGGNDVADEATVLQQPKGARLVLTDRASETAGQSIEKSLEQIGREPSASDPRPLRSNALEKWLGLDDHHPGKHSSGGLSGRQTVSDHMNGSAQPSREGRSEQPGLHGRIQQNGPFISKVSERQTAFSQKVSGETVAVAQGAAMQAGEKLKQPQDNPVARIETSPTFREEVMSVKPSEGTEMQMNGNASREGAPSFDSHLSTAAPKLAGASVSAKEATPFVDRETQTDVIRQIVQRMTLKSDHKHSQMIIRLKPEFLGHVRLQVTTEGHQVMVRMDAESNMVKEIVEHNMPHLKAELHQHGLQIEKFDVFVGSDNDGWRSGQQQTGFRQPTKRSGQHFSSAPSDDDSFDHPSDVNNRGLRAGSYNSGEVDYFA